MSYREIRKFCEVMKALGYPRLVSVESFRKPNFELVADILYWLVQRHDPSADISEDIITESARIQFLKSIAELLQIKLHVKLSIKKLYQADGVACQELLKLALVLQTAMTMQNDEKESEHDDVQGFDSKSARAMATELTNEGNRLYELLTTEAQFSDVRTRVISRQQDNPTVERSLQSLLDEIRQQKVDMENAVVECKNDVESLRSKIEHKRTELDRTKKRLMTLQSTRPAHQDEFEKMELELSMLYSSYLQNFRNLEYLENSMSHFTEQEDRLIREQEESLRILRDRLRRENLKNIREHEKMEEEAAMTAAQQAQQAPGAGPVAAGVPNRGNNAQNFNAGGGRTKPNVDDGVVGGYHAFMMSDQRGAVGKSNSGGMDVDGKGVSNVSSGKFNDEDSGIRPGPYGNEGERPSSVYARQRQTDGSKSGNTANLTVSDGRSNNSLGGKPNLSSSSVNDSADSQADILRFDSDARGGPMISTYESKGKSAGSGVGGSSSGAGGGGGSSGIMNSTGDSSEESEEDMDSDDSDDGLDDDSEDEDNVERNLDDDDDDDDDDSEGDSDEDDNDD